MLADFLIRNTSEVLTCAGPAPRAGARQADARSISRAAVAAHQGRIVFIGFESLIAREVQLTPGALVIDAHGGSVVPGFVDPHTHVVFAGDRRAELRRRLSGTTYEEIAAEGGGILSTVVATRAATEPELAAATRVRLDEMLRAGTTTCEAKSGYGLTEQDELKMLRVIRALAAEHPIELAATFMGAHEVPREYRDRHSAYVDLVIEKMIPAVAETGLAEWCDVFCERDVFTPEEARSILTAARAAGMKLRIHADELAASGGSAVAADLRVRSADHLIFMDEQNAKRFAAAGVVATLLPVASFYLKLDRFAPGRLLIHETVPVALATDVNPGGGFSPSMPFAMALACFHIGLTFEEALVAATINAAYALDRHDRVGSLEIGKQMDAVIVNGPAIDLIRVGAQTIGAVIKRGRIVVDNLERVAKLPAALRSAGLEACHWPPGSPEGLRYVQFRDALLELRASRLQTSNCHMSLIDLSTRDLLTAFSSSDPTPGGGSAAALASSVGASLLLMVAGLPKTRSNSDADRAALHGAATKLTGLRQQLTEAIDADTAAYDQVVAAYRLAKETDEEKRLRKDAIQRALRAATDVPLRVMRLSADALRESSVVSTHGHPGASSDVGVAVALLSAGLDGARLNVDVNVGSIDDRGYVEAVRGEVERLRRR